MHPPFYTVDLRVGPDTHTLLDEKPKVRRSAPARLRLSPAGSDRNGTPFCGDIAQQAQTSPVRRPMPVLKIVPPPRNRLKDRLGRWLIRAGQRMILENLPG